MNLPPGLLPAGLEVLFRCERLQCSGSVPARHGGLSSLRNVTTDTNTRPTCLDQKDMGKTT